MNFLFILLISSGLGQSLFAQNTVNPLPFSVAQLEQDLRSLKEFVSLLNQVLKNHDQASLNKEQLSILNVLSNKDLTKNIRLNSNSEKFKSRRKDINKLLNDTINSLKKYPLSTIYSGKLEKNLEEISVRIHNLLENYPSQSKALLLPMGFDKPVKMESLIQ
ncbi:MAG: hypothetical protein VX642_10910, partial [Bdellovibrionota bacterium]|nr:hypothetical protein [Bdellovibrionota bacterium]